MSPQIAPVTLLVREYDEALTLDTDLLGFELLEDTRLARDKRWIVVAPPGASGSALLLARASTPEQQSHVGNQTGGRVAFFLRTDDFERDYREFASRGVHFIEEPRSEAYGIVAVFVDLYGNRWDLVQPGAR
jgi:catechol 2,3-dioxygenase-like lactoylglutathione lyase family enzyme